MLHTKQHVIQHSTNAKAERHKDTHHELTANRTNKTRTCAQTLRKPASANNRCKAEYQSGCRLPIDSEIPHLVCYAHQHKHTTTRRSNARHTRHLYVRCIILIANWICIPTRFRVHYLWFDTRSLKLPPIM